MRVKRITIHCTATRPEYDIGAEEVRVLHTTKKGVPIVWCGKDLKGPGFADIGYHAVIRRDGTLEAGRNSDVQGAHVLGHNENNYGLALVGGIDKHGDPGSNYTHEQWAKLKEHVDLLEEVYGPLDLFGHRDFTDKKACPCFDVKAWRNGGTQ